MVMSDHGSRLGQIGLIADDEAERVRNFMAIRSPGTPIWPMTFTPMSISSRRCSMPTSGRSSHGSRT